MQCSIATYMSAHRPRRDPDREVNEMSDVQKFGEEFQRVGKDGFDAAVSSFGEQGLAGYCR